MTITDSHSGAANMYKYNIKPIDIMKITGHKTEKAFIIRITAEENANSLMGNPFFNPSLKIAE